MDPRGSGGYPTNVAKGDEPSTRPLLDKLGVRPGMRVATLGPFAVDFLTPLSGRAAERVADPAGCDVVFLAVEDRAQLVQVAALAASLRRDATLWIVRPRGSTAISERETLAAGLEAGLVDVKVVHFSETHSAAKFVYRLRDRRPAAG